MKAIPPGLPRVVDMTREQLCDEAKRLAFNCRLTGMEYTAEVLKRLAELVK